MKMKRIVGGVLAATVLASAGVADAGCLGGAMVGGVAGHFAGHHPILGAAAGCAVGHHMAVVRRRQLRAQRGY